MKQWIHITSYVEIITGDNSFKAEHKFLNIATVLGFLFFSFFLAINVFFNVDILLGVIKLIGICVSASMFYFSRHRRVFTWTSNVFFIYLICSYFFIGLRNGGVTGGIAPIYTAILALMLFIIKGSNLNYLFALWMLSITGLFVVEYFRPESIVPYLSRDQKYIDLYLSYASGIGMITMVVIIVKRLYIAEKLNLEEMMIKYRKYHVDIKENISLNKNSLTVREREICEYILEGLSNQDIAEKLFITQGTVKCHINNIYKKLGTNKRADLLDYYPKL